MLGNKAYESGVLDPNVHDLLVKDLERFVAKANIPIEMVWTPMKTYCTDAEIEYMKHLRQQSEEGQLGLVYQTPHKYPIQTRMFCAAGVCLRNFIDARVATVQNVIAELRKDDCPDNSVLMIPNFCIEKDEGGQLPQWQVSMLLGMLYTRHAQSKQTFLGVSSVEQVGLDYGSPFEQHLRAHFTII